MDKIDQLEKDIKSLKIQGATNVALSTLYGIIEGIEIIKKSNTSTSPYKYLKDIGSRLSTARPTEPLAQNAIRFIFASSGESLDYYLEKTKQYKKMIADTKEKIINASLPVIENGGVYLTHCHSSTVVSMFRQARKMGKRFSVYATETRPLYQGRATVRELLNAGVEDVTLIIDDVVESIILGRLKHIDAVFIGCDLLSKNGFVNKVGSLGVAYAVNQAKVPLFCLASLLKYDPRNYSPSLIEYRDSDEIWKEAPKGLKIYAPAFDYIPYKENISLISEVGILKISEIVDRAFALYPFLNNNGS